MSRYIENYKKNIAVDMRKRGLSYSEIETRIHVPKSTLFFWLKEIKLTKEQKKKLDDDRLKALKRGSEKKIKKTLQVIEELKISASSDIKEITKKELWLMGIILYWRERLLSGNESDLRKGVRFTSSDPYLIKLFLKWLQDIGGIKDEEIRFDIFITKDKERPKKSVSEIIAFWSDVTGFPENRFSKVYTLKTREKRKKGGREITNKTKVGLLRIRVSSSSMLARQIAGWVKGIIKYYWE